MTKTKYYLKEKCVCGCHTGKWLKQHPIIKPWQQCPVCEDTKFIRGSEVTELIESFIQLLELSDDGINIKETINLNFRNLIEVVEE